MPITPRRITIKNLEQFAQAMLTPDPKHCVRKWLFDFTGKAYELLIDRRFAVGTITGDSLATDILIADNAVAPAALAQLDGYARDDLERAWFDATDELLLPSATLDAMQSTFAQLRAEQRKSGFAGPEDETADKATDDDDENEDWPDEN